MDEEPVVVEGATPGEGTSWSEGASWSEGLRERKKRLTRQLITNTATAMFLERGFDDVKVTDVAEACGVSEKTVYNYFPTKESLLFDREPDLAASIWRALGPGSSLSSPVEATLELVRQELEMMYTSWLDESTEVIARFAELIDATPALQAAQREMSERLERTAAEALAERAGVSPDDPEPRIAAVTLTALLQILYSSVRRYAVEGRSADETRQLVLEEVQRAARVVESGLLWFEAAIGDRDGRPQLNAAAAAADHAGREVVEAMLQARAAWAKAFSQGRPEGASEDSSLQGLTTWIEQAARWKRDFKGQQDDWKRAYRQQQSQLRQAQRELQQHFRQARQQLHHAARGSRPQPGRRGPGPQADGGEGGRR